MISHRVLRREAKRLYRLCLEGGRVNESRVRLVIDHILAQRPRGHIRLLIQFQRLIKLDIQRRTARVETAVPMPEDLQALLREQVTRRYGTGLHWEYQVKPDLIGGLRLRVGSDVYDATIQGRLMALAESFDQP
ncbi:MAG: F0F1 ATP synthase subunit delta [Verrucomicrobiota bacterium]|nr:F0F1 ATP synthase subunit delta [Limisphaera sp.]MDW8381602.1 F0F1 ATP synthase subunit delta [Verrucomicrobiota bacterium]